LRSSSTASSGPALALLGELAGELLELPLALPVVPDRLAGDPRQAHHDDAGEHQVGGEPVLLAALQQQVGPGAHQQRRAGEQRAAPRQVQRHGRGDQHRDHGAGEHRGEAGVRHGLRQQHARRGDCQSLRVRPAQEQDQAERHGEARRDGTRAVRLLEQPDVELQRHDGAQRQQEVTGRGHGRTLVADTASRRRPRG
jgi:hypothetical protein